jgi:hypothetical protein
MNRTPIVLVAGLVAVASVAAPVPKESPAEKLKRLYGTCVDPDRDCAFTMQGDALRLRVGGGPHRLVPSTGPSNAPRTVRTVEGDFTASARIRLVRPLHPDPPGVALHAGLFVTPADGSVVYFARRVLNPAGQKPQVTAINGVWSNGQLDGAGSAAADPFTAESVVFRIRRSGREITCDASEDGKSEWTRATVLTVALPDRVSVGVFAGHDGRSAFEAVFEKFVVAPAKSK